jgi:recombinational DNA repair protein RecR
MQRQGGGQVFEESLKVLKIRQLNLKYFLFTMEDMSTRSGNKLTEEQIEQLIKRLRGVEHIEPIVTIDDSNVNNEKMATFAEVAQISITSGRSLGFSQQRT